jgi:acetolactate synthase-1/2/3 large subunit
MVRQWQELFYDRRYAETVMDDNPDFTTIAKGYGVKSRKISKREDVIPAIKEMLKHDGAYVLEVEIEREENVFPMVPAGESIDRAIGGMA